MNSSEDYYPEYGPNSGGDSGRNVGQLPPSDLDAERTLLGSMLLDNGCIPYVADVVGAQDFHSTAHQTIFKAVMAVFAIHELCDLTLLADELKRTHSLESVGGWLTLANLEQFVLGTDAAPAIAEIVKRHSTARRAIAIAKKVVEVCLEGSKSPFDIASEAQQSFFEIGQERPDIGPTFLPDWTDDTIDHMLSLSDTPREKLGVSTHVPDLDSILLPFSAGELIMLGAGPSVGKTAISVHLAIQNAMLGKHGLLCELEMSDLSLRMRIACYVAGVDNHSARMGRLSRNHKEALHASRPRVKVLPVTILDRPGITIEEIIARTMKLSATKPVHYVVIDHLQLLGYKGGRDTDEKRISEITKAAKNGAKTLGCPIILLSQFSRDVFKERRRPELSDFRGSGMIEANADTVLALHWPTRNEDIEKDGNPDTPVAEKRFRSLEACVLKQREGPIGIAPILFEKATGRIYSPAKVTGAVPRQCDVAMNKPRERPKTGTETD